MDMIGGKKGGWVGEVRAATDTQKKEATNLLILASDVWRNSLVSCLFSFVEYKEQSNTQAYNHLCSKDI